MNLGQIIEKAKKNISDITGLPLNSISGMTRDAETNDIRLEVELTERKGIPDSMDLLGIYEIVIDENGNISEFSRTGMRKRGDTAIEQVEEY